MLDIQNIRAKFPALQHTVHGKPLIYLDNAATTQKPQAVLDALARYYQNDNANVHRGMHALATRATDALEATRRGVQQFIGAADASEIIFTAGTTASINLVAATYGQAQVQAGDEVIISQMEHHANIVPWQRLCQEKKATLKVIPINTVGELLLSEFDQLLTKKTKIVALCYASNTLGTINPLKKIIQKAHAQGAIVVVDGAQAAPHFAMNVQELACDFLTFSAHKAYGPTGVGVLYGKQKLLEAMPPYQVGGAMVKRVSLTRTIYNDLPYKFEAGTPHIAGIIAWKDALSFINQVGYTHIEAHENQLLTCASNLLGRLRRVRLIGTARKKIGVLSFTVQDMHPLDVGMLLDAQGIAVRTGHGCTQPLMDFFEIEGVVRASFAVYNTIAEAEAFAKVVARIVGEKI